MVLLALALVDGLLRITVAGAGFLLEPHELQDAGMLVAKLEALEQRPGPRPKVVTTGSSVVFGGAMKSHGNDAWQNHTLAAKLAQQLDAPVLNLGMDGMLPTDIEAITELLLQRPRRPDLLVFDVNLRAFSADFAAGASQISRPWLRELAGMAPLEGSASPSYGHPAAAVERTLKRWLVRHWLLYRLRSSLQQRLFGGAPGDRLAEAWKHLNHQLRPSPETTAERLEEQAFERQLALIMKTKGRLATAALDVEHPQRAALVRLLERLAAVGQQTVVFYATENPQLAPQLLAEQRAEALRAELRALVERHGGATVTYIPPLAQLTAERFLDPSHLDAEGHRVLAEMVAAAFRATLEER
tara:strand:- start:400 stop:1470 length:1071 start_codon:yes stop_codon:yes gene_type:complete